MIEVERLSKRYLLGETRPGGTLREALSGVVRRVRGGGGVNRREELWALRDVDLVVAEGDSIGVIGRNGAGKSTLLKILARITEPTSGMARMRGRVAALLEVGTGFHPELTGKENVYLNGAILGMSRRDITRRFDDIITFAGVERFIDTPVKRYSSGMYLRLAFAVAAHLEPDILVVDEILAVGDSEFQAKCLRRMETAEQEGRTVVFVSHNLGAVNRLCQRAVWLDKGRVHESGATADVVESYVRAQARGEAALWSGSASGPVVVESVAVTDDAGRQVGTLQRDETVVIEVRYTLRAPVQGLDLAAFVQRAHGPEILCESWADTAADRPGDPGQYVARLRIPPVLNVGEYVVGLWMGDPYETFVHEMTVQRFHLAGDDQNRPNRQVALRLPWEVEQLEPSSHQADR